MKAAAKEGYESFGRVLPRATAKIKEWGYSWCWWFRHYYFHCKYVTQMECEIMWDDVCTWYWYFRTGNFYNPHGSWVVPMYKKVFNALLGNWVWYVCRQISIPAHTLTWIVRQRLGMVDEWDWVQRTYVDSGEMGWAYAE